MKKILLVFTGGTICTSSEDGVRSLATDSAKHKITENFAKSKTEFSELSDKIFETASPLNILSENMDKQSLGKLIGFFKAAELEKYSGVIVLHGTDTLAYSCAMISLLFGNSPVPIVFVSANAPLDNPASNGNDNFAFAVGQILGGNLKSGGVFAAYKNISDGTMHLHKGYRIMQSENFSEDFKSADVPKPKDAKLTQRLGEITAEILYITPYVGINYGSYNLKDVDAVLHGTYHSGTLESNSFSEFAKRCAAENIPVYIVTCKSADDETYGSSEKLKSENIIFLNDITAETAYCRLLAAYSVFGGKEAEKAVLNM